MGQDDWGFIQVLMELGLSFVQAKVYLVLVGLGEADVRTVSLVSGVSRQEVCGVILELEELGLVQRTMAVPVDGGVDLLFEKEEQKIRELEERVLRFIKSQTRKEVWG